MLNPSLQAGVAAPHEAVPCKGATAEKDHRYDRYQRVTGYKRGAIGHVMLSGRAGEGPRSSVALPNLIKKI
jgi:hypothetical protein